MAKEFACIKVGKIREGLWWTVENRTISLVAGGIGQLNILIELTAEEVAKLVYFSTKFNLKPCRQGVLFPTLRSQRQY